MSGHPIGPFWPSIRFASKRLCWLSLFIRPNVRGWVKSSTNMPVTFRRGGGGRRGGIHLENALCEELINVFTANFMGWRFNLLKRPTMRIRTGTKRRKKKRCIAAFVWGVKKEHCCRLYMDTIRKQGDSKNKNLPLKIILKHSTKEGKEWYKLFFFKKKTSVRQRSQIYFDNNYVKLHRTYYI